jgi:hypothetical protein
MNGIKTTGVTDLQLNSLDKLFKDNNWSMIVGETIEDCLLCDGLKSITVHNNENGFVMSVMYDQKLLKKFYSIDEALSDALLTYFIKEYYDEV